MDPNIPNDKKHTSSTLQLQENTSCVQALISSGKCDFAVQDRKGRIPAMDTSDEAIKSMLIEATAR